MIIIPILIYLGVMLFIAFYLGKEKNQSGVNFIEEYFMGSRSMGGLVLAMTIIATYVGASSFIAGPGQAYSIGLSWVLLACIQTPTAFLTLGILGKKLAIISRKIGAVTITDYLRARYENEVVVAIASISIICFSIGAIVVQFVGGARLFESVTGFSYFWGLLIFAVVVTFYTSFGGFRAVTATDAIQGIVMLIATGILFVTLLRNGGGMENIMRNIAATKPELLTPTSGGVIGKPFILSFWILVGVGILGLPSTTIRCMGFKDSKSMHSAMIIGTSVVGILMLGMHLIAVMGIGINPNLTVPDKVIPDLAIAQLHPILAGVFIAGPIAAIMSTIDSLLIMSSANIIKDFYLRYFKKNNSISEKEIKKISLITSFTLGIIVFIFALRPPKLLVTMNLLFLAGQQAIFFSPIIFGLYWKKANATGALASMILGFSVYLFLFIYKIQPFGTHPIVLVILVSVTAFILGTYAGKPNKISTIELFFNE